MKFDTIELSDAELEAVYGSQGFPGLGSGALGTGLGTGLGGTPFGGLFGGPGGSFGLGASESAATSERVHSFGVTCDINIFSLNAIVLPIVNIADCTNQICANSN